MLIGGYLGNYIAKMICLFVLENGSRELIGKCALQISIQPEIHMVLLCVFTKQI